MKLSTRGRRGKNDKSIRVETNDPLNSTFNLNLAVEVIPVMTFTPPTVFLKGTVGENISQVVTAVPTTEKPLTILRTNTLKQGNFSYSMHKSEIEGKIEYQFFIENTNTSTGSYMDKLLIFTDNTEINPIVFIVRGDIQPDGSNQIISEKAPTTPRSE
jgi:hypothetical protein